MFYYSLKRLIKKTLTPWSRTMNLQTSLFDKIARFLACEKIEGDYLEFGVYRGDTFASHYKIIESNFKARIQQDGGGGEYQKDALQRQEIWDVMRFFAFDSFEGLPILTTEDKESNDFSTGQYACSQEAFMSRVINKGVSKERAIPVKGWFEDTCNSQTISQHNIQKAAVVFIDCDIYSATKTVLDFIIPFLQDGTVLVFDDWFSYRGHPERGEQRAFNEWRFSEEVAPRYHFSEFHKDSWKRNSFIVNNVLNK